MCNILFSFVQVESIKKIAEYVAQLRLVGKGHGMHIFSSASLSKVVIAFHLLIVIGPLAYYDALPCLLCPYVIKQNLVLLCSNRITVLWLLSGVWHFDQKLLHDEDHV